MLKQAPNFCVSFAEGSCQLGDQCKFQHRSKKEVAEITYNHMRGRQNHFNNQAAWANDDEGCEATNLAVPCVQVYTDSCQMTECESDDMVLAMPSISCMKGSKFNNVVTYKPRVCDGPTIGAKCPCGGTLVTEGGPIAKVLQEKNSPIRIPIECDWEQGSIRHEVVAYIYCERCREIAKTWYKPQAYCLSNGFFS